MVTWGINYMQFVGCLHVFHITIDLTSLSENNEKKKIV